ncbi:MAG: 3-oxoacid CoA-transferase [Planctomycetota bacterium]
MKKLSIISPAQAATRVSDGNKLLVGGFGMTGCPVNLLHALAETSARDLTYIGNGMGEAGLGGGRLLRNGQIRKAIGSYFTGNREAVEAAQAGEIEVELIPQGTLAEAIRAGGAGIGGFYTPTSAETDLADGKETRRINGLTMVFVEPICGDVAFLRAWKADTAGNLQYRMTENNFNQAMATAAKTVIAEVQQIVPAGELSPEVIHTPGCFVDYLVEAQISEASLGTSASIASSDKKVDEARMAMAKAALDTIRPGEIVNLGIGIPTLVADLIRPEQNIVLHSENGMLGVGPEPTEGGAMEHPVNAGKIPVTTLPGASYFDSATCFAIIRGGHVDVAIMGGLQVDQEGNLANWSMPGKPLLGVGGAMDLAVGAKRLVIIMTHRSKDGHSKVLPECTLPLTAKKAVHTLITDLAVFDFKDDQMVLKRLMPGASLEQVRAATEASFFVANDLQQTDS